MAAGRGDPCAEDILAFLGDPQPQVHPPTPDDDGDIAHVHARTEVDAAVDALFNTTSARADAKRKRDVPAPLPLHAETAEAVGPIPDATIASIAEREVKPNRRKSKFRRRGPDPASIPDIGSAPAAAVMPPPRQMTRHDMPPIHSTEAMDQWTQLLNDPSAYEKAPGTVIRSAAEALRETIRTEEEQKRLGSVENDESGAAAAGVDLSDNPPSQASLTIRQFFSGDFSTPLTGIASDAHELFTRIQEEMTRRDALVDDVFSEVTRTAPTAVAIRQAAAAVPDVGDVGTDGVTAEAADKTGGRVQYAMLEKCGRTYCGDFLREAREVNFGERPCIRGRNCVFMVIAGNFPESASETASEERFVCREFLRPTELAHWKDTGDLPAMRRTCLGCNRMITSMAYFAYKQRDEQPTYLLQDHYNDVDDDMDGYDQSHCLSPVSNSGEWCGIALPFVEFEPMRLVPTQFEMHAQSTGQRWRLKGVTESQADFRNSPSSYYREVAETIVARAVRAAAVARRDYRTVSDVDDLHAHSASDRDAIVTAALVVTTRPDGPPLARPPPPPPVWVAGPKDMEVGGVSAIRPFRSSEWIAAETAACPLVHSASPLEPFLPRLLLGRLFPLLADNVFCPFMETVAAIRREPNHFLQVLGSNLRNLPTFYSFDATILKVVHDDMARAIVNATANPTPISGIGAVTPSPDSIPRYAVLMALLWRVDRAMLMARNPRRRGSGSYWLQLFVDTHIDLALNMHTRGIYDDARLEDPMGNQESLYKSYLDIYMPHDTRCIHSGDLPDISGILQYGSVWYQGDRRAYAGTIMEALDHMIVYKSQQHKCKVRNLAQILHGYACEHPQLMNILRAIVTVSLLGNYAHAEIRPEFETRLHIVYSMRPRVSDDRALFHWIGHNDGIVHGALKEFYRFTVGLRPGFEIILLMTTYWKTVSRAICFGMDRVRAMMPLSVAGGTITGLGPPGPDGVRPLQAGDPILHAAAMEAASECLNELHRRVQLPMIHKSRKGPFTDAITQDMNHYFASDIMNNKIVRPQSSLTELAHDIGREDAEFVLRAMWRIVQTRVPQHRAGEPLELGWLSFFGVSEEGMLLLRTLAYDFEMKDIADNAMTDRVEALYTTRPRDFFLIHIFFVLVRDWRATQSFKLPSNYIQTQTVALKSKWKVLPWKSLPDKADVFYYCPACSRWLADVVDASIPKSFEKIHSIGVRHALYSDQTGRLYCGLQKVSVNTRKQVESGDYDDLDRELKSVTEAKRVRHFLHTPSCAATPVIGVHMLGRVQLLGGRQYALCMICGSLCPWEAHRFGPNGFTCGFHGKDAPIMLTTRQEDAAVDKARRRHRQLNAACSYCAEQLKPRGQYVRIWTIDDVGTIGLDGEKIAPPTYTYMRYTLCAQCSHAIRTPEIVRVRSRVNNAIRRIREWFRLRESNMTRAGRSRA